MKKIHIILVLIVLMLFLNACDDTDEIVDPIDLDVNVKLVEFEGTTFNVHVVIPIEVASLNDLNEITLDIARQMYDVQVNEIGTVLMVLTVYLYKNNGDFTLRDATFGYHEFTINASPSSPGLSMGANHLKLN